VLEVERATKKFGGLIAVDAVDLELREGEILAVIGPNGAGKSTLLNLLSGLYRPDSGAIRLGDLEITRLSPEARCHLGLGRAFQIVQPFPEMTVRENLLVGALYGKPSTPRAEAERRVDEVLALTGLAPRADQAAAELTLVEDKRLELARALATNPRILLLDEVMAGLRPAEGAAAVDLVKRIRDSGVSVLFIEHVMPVVRRLADRVIVMDYGKVIAEGGYADVAADPKVREAYLGKTA